MKTLLSTTALVLGLGLPTLVLAQTATENATTETTGTDMTGFLSARGQSDIYASELMGHYVYARRSPFAGDDQATTGQATTGTDGNVSETGTGEVADSVTGDDGTATTGVAGADGTTTEAMQGSGQMTVMNSSDLDNMDNIGQINEIILSPDGEVRALVIGVGGFLGMGEQDVAVTMDQVTIATDAEDPTETYVVVNTGADVLQTSPAFDRSATFGGGTGAMDGMTGTDTALTTGQDATGTVGATDQTGTGAATSDRTRFTAPSIEREGYEQLVVGDVSTEMLVGKNVYGLNDESVGTIDDLLVDDQGAITNVIIDFGGFLGLGTSQVSVGYDELAVLADSNRSDVRVYIDATKEQVQAQPLYEPAN